MADDISHSCKDFHYLSALATGEEEGFPFSIFLFAGGTAASVGQDNAMAPEK